MNRRSFLARLIGLVVAAPVVPAVVKAAAAAQPVVPTPVVLVLPRIATWRECHWDIRQTLSANAIRDLHTAEDARFLASISPASHSSSPCDLPDGFAG